MIYVRTEFSKINSKFQKTSGAIPPLAPLPTMPLYFPLKIHTESELHSKKPEVTFSRTVSPCFSSIIQLKLKGSRYD